MEIKRILSFKILIFLFLCFSVNLLIHYRINSDTDAIKLEYVKLVDQYREVEIRTAIKDIKDQNERRDQVEIDQLTSNNGDDVEDTEEQATSLLLDQLNYIDQYTSRIDQVLLNADSMLNVSTFNDTNKFSYHNIIRTRQDFSGLKDSQPVLINSVAAKDYIEYDITWYFVYAIALLVIFEMLKDRDNGMVRITYTSAGGRLHLSLKRLGILVVITLSTSVLFCGSIFIYDVIRYSGIGDLHNSIQCIDTCAYVMLRISILRYLILDFTTSWFVVTAITMFTYVLFLLIKSRKLTLCMICIFIGIEYVLYQKIDTHSTFAIFRSVNIIKLFEYGTLLSEYKNWGIGNFIIPLKELILYVASIICVFAVMTSIYLSTKVYPVQTKKLKFICYLEELVGKLTSRCTQGGFELYKILFLSKGYIVTAIVLLICGLVLYNSTITFSRQQQSHDAEYLKYGGEDYTYFRNYVDDVNQKIEEAKQQLNDVANNQTDLSSPNTEYYMALSQYQYETNYKVYIAEYEKKLEYLDKLEYEYGITGYIMSDRGYEEMFGSSSENKNIMIMLVLSCGLVLLLSDGFSIEKSTAMLRLIRTAKHGREKFYKKKVFICLMYAMITSFIVIGFQWGILFSEYGHPYINAPIQSLTFMESCPVKCTIIQWLIIMILLKLIWYLGISMITISVSIIALNRNSRTVMVILLLLTITADLVFLKNGIWIQVFLTVTGLIVGIIFMCYACNRWSKGHY